MISPKMQDALNKQLNAELYSAYLYRSMAAYFESLFLRGLAHWMTVQAGEEEVHAKKFFEFINDRGGRVLLAAIEAPPTEWSSPLAVFEEVYKHEREVTGLIHDLVGLAAKEKDPASHAFLQWFVTEQVEEEASAEEVVAKLKMVGESKGGLLVLDHHLGKRGKE